MIAPHGHEVDTGPLDLDLFVGLGVVGPRIIVLYVNFIHSTESRI